MSKNQPPAAVPPAPTLSASTINPLIDSDREQTILNTMSLLQFLARVKEERADVEDLTPSALSAWTANEQRGFGLALQCAISALNFFTNGNGGAL